MKSKVGEVHKLEAELLRLNTLVRARRAQLAKLETCPNKDCECRRVWQDVVEKDLASQVGKVRKQVNGKKRTVAAKSTKRAG